MLESGELNPERVEEKLFQVQYVAPFSGRQVGMSAARHVNDLYNMSNSWPVNIPFILIIHTALSYIIYEPLNEKTSLQGF